MKQNHLLVHEVYPNGAASRDNRLRPGDHITQINSISLIGVPFLEAVDHILSAYNSAVAQQERPSECVPENTVTALPEINTFVLTVVRPAVPNTKWYDQELTMEMTKKAGKGLGLCIADRCMCLSDAVSVNESGEINQHSGPPSLRSYGSVITEVVRGSLAATDGRLLVNDQILNVNGEDTVSANSQVVGMLLKDYNLLYPMIICFADCCNQGNYKGWKTQESSRHDTILQFCVCWIKGKHLISSGV
ncbi:hypothetical protein AHF37_10112 [Paragonimus kellicotti]|nr:hypothetical protein AHF37_10112 [Paragonimus kellicotti]